MALESDSGHNFGPGRCLLDINSLSFLRFLSTNLRLWQRCGINIVVMAVGSSILCKLLMNGKWTWLGISVEPCRKRVNMDSDRVVWLGAGHAFSVRQA